MKLTPTISRRAGKLRFASVLTGLFAVAAFLGGPVHARAQDPFPPAGPPRGGDFGPGPGGPGPMQAEIQLVKKFDLDQNQRLDETERKAAREFIQKERAEGRVGRGPGGRRGPGPGFRGPDENQEPPQPGRRISPADAKAPSDAPLYDPFTLRTLFLQFENSDWEKELSDFSNTDVEVPARLMVDGKTYRDVGVHFRGASSYFTVGEGFKRSLNLSLDFVHEDQRLGGYRTINLLNSHADPSFLRTVLYYQIAREYIPAPKANFVRVVINGESWGIYVNSQQFNKDFVRDWFDTTQGARWKVPGSPRGRGGLTYLGEDASAYRTIYEIKSKDTDESWAALIRLCRVLQETPAEKLEVALAPLLDIDGALKFLALENALINNDGYWVRASDYLLYRDVQGRFHLVPHDANETFSVPGGPGFGGPRGRRPPPSDGGQPATEQRPQGVNLDPLSAANDSEKPLLSKLLAVPALRARYLGYVREIAQNWLDWGKKLGPIAGRYHDLIVEEVRLDTRKLSSFQAFEDSFAASQPSGNVAVDNNQRGPGPGGFGRQRITLRGFADQRRTYLLEATRSAEPSR